MIFIQIEKYILLLKRQEQKHTDIGDKQSSSIKDWQPFDVGKL